MHKRNRIFMKRSFALLFLASGICAGQTAIDVQNVVAAAQATLTTLQTITGTDGTVCVLSKVANAKIFGWFACTLANQTLKTVQIQSTSAVSGFTILGQSQALCLIGINPTNAIVSFGSVGNAPVNGITWSCANGANGILLNGTVSWP